MFILQKLMLLTMLLVFFIGGNVSAQEIRVALVKDQATAEISCDDEFEVSDGVKVRRLPKGKYFIHGKNGRLSLNDDNTFGAELQIKAVEGKKLPQVNKRTYNGRLDVHLTGEELLVVNILPLENYLASVLPAKTMVVWPDEAIKAQAVAARSYALYMHYQNRYQPYDLLATDKELYYEGSGKRIEKDAITKLLQATAGQYLADYNGLPIQAVTTSSSGGRTESAADLWNKDIYYLRSVEDYDNDSPEYTWEQRVTPSLLEDFLAQRGYNVGKLTSIRLSPLKAPADDRTVVGRVKYLLISGDKGSAQISGQDLVDMLSLPSTFFDLATGTPPPDKLNVPIEDPYGFQIGSKDIDIKLKESNKPIWQQLSSSYHLLSGVKEEKIIFHGKGKGTGLGLSAWGARGFVNIHPGADYRKILMHYYPGSRLVY